MPQVVIKNTSTKYNKRKLVITNSVKKVNNSPSDANKIKIKVINHYGSVQLIFESPLKTSEDIEEFKSEVNIFSPDTEILVNEKGNKITIFKIFEDSVAKIQNGQNNELQIYQSVPAESVSDQISIQYDRYSGEKEFTLIDNIKKNWKLFLVRLREGNTIITPSEKIRHGVPNIYLDRINF